MRVLLWTQQALADLAAIRAFINQDSSHYASIVIARIIGATDRLAPFPESGRIVPEFDEDDLVRIIDESGEDYLFHKAQFAFVDFPQAVRKKILAMQRAS